MPTITLNKEAIEKEIGKIDKKIEEKITLLGVEIDEITETEITLDITPNRPDMLSEQGFIRAFSAFINKNPGLRQYKVNKSDNKVIIEDSVKDVRPFTVCAIVKNIKFTDQLIKDIIQTQEKLHLTFCRNRKKAAIGIYPCEKIKFPIRYLALPPSEIKFQPLEESTVMNGNEILSKTATGREYAYLLEKFSKYPIFIDANNNILSMPPIINSHLTGKVTEETKDVFIECSGFDLLTLNQLLNIIVTLLADMSGEIYSLQLYYGNKKIITPDLKNQEININVTNINELLGINLKETDFKSLLAKMGLDYKNKKAIIPAYRTDILHEVDIAEDIAIAYGYDNLKAELPNIATIAKEDDFEVFKRKISQLLIGFDLIEVSTYHLSNLDTQAKKMNANINCIEIENPNTAEYNLLRAWLIPSLIEVLQKNKHNEYPQKIFEIGTVFKPEEVDRLVILLCHSKANFTEIKQLLDYLANALNFKYEIKDIEHGSFIPGRVGRIAVNGKDIAYIGELHPKVLENFELENPVIALELNLTDLFKLK